MNQPGRLLVTRYGAAATAALRRLVALARGGDPLAPVDVVMPTGVAGVTVRRQLADPGLANVRFGSLPQLAERLAAPRLAAGGHAPPLPSFVRAAATRSALARGSGRLTDTGGQDATAGLLEGLFVELDEDEVSGEALERLAAASTRGREIADLYRTYRGLVAGYAVPSAVADAATEAVLAGAAPSTTVIVHAPRRLPPAERRLLAALAARGRLHAVVCLTGEEEADRDARELADWLGQHVKREEDTVAPPARKTRVIVAPDAEEEVRLAVRRTLDALAAGTRPDRVALTYRSAAPYSRLLSEQLTAAGVPHHAPSQRTLAQTVAGRTLLGLLDLALDDYPRTELSAWLRDAPVLDADGRRVPAARWDRISRDAGVYRGPDQWRQRLDNLAGLTLEKRSTVGDDDADVEQRRERYDRLVTDTRRLATFVDDLITQTTSATAAATWSDADGALRELLVRYLGTTRVRDRWGGETGSERWVGLEREAYDGALAVLDTIAGLDHLEATAPSPGTLRQAVARELDRPLRSGTTLGRGVLVAPISDLVGADLDLVVVLGMTEDAFPPRLREHPLLRDADRQAAGCGLPLLADRRRAERSAFLAALAAAGSVILSYPRADTRAQRAQHPGPWLLEAVECLNQDVPVESSKLAGYGADWLERHDSFVSSLHRATTAASVHEYDVRLALSGLAELLEIADARFGRGREAVAARREGMYGEWLGGVAPMPRELVERADRALSATSLEAWATCPLTFWLKHLLRVRDLEDPGEEDQISPLERGSLVHAVLEDFFGDDVRDGRRKPPDEPWTAQDVRRARALLDEKAAELEAAGRTGRPLLWQAQKAKMHRQLARILAVDSDLRARQRSWPLAVEEPFGRDGRPPLALALGESGTVTFRGSIDRIDATEDGGIVVVDYKTGRGYGFENIPEDDDAVEGGDLVDRGRKLQLVLYALAAREARRDDPPSRVEAYYWFVELGALRRGAPIGSAEEQRLLEVLDIEVSGIRGGVFPANPGAWDSRGHWEHCRYCPYHRICPSTRGEIYERVRTHVSVSAYHALAHPEAGQGGDR